MKRFSWGKSYSEKMCKDKEAYLKKGVAGSFWDLELFRFFMEL